MPLLPPDRDAGWTRYVWLIYLLLFVSYPLRRGASGLEWVLVAAGLAAFFPLYFGGFWLVGRRKLWAAAGLAALGAGLFPLNPGASVFFVYAAAFIGEIGETRLAACGIAALCCVIAMEGLLLERHPVSWISGLVLALMIGGVSVHDAQRRDANRKLSIAQQEIEHLAKVAERERIGRDLHDLLGHTLTLIVLKAELAGKDVEKDPSGAAAAFREIESIARQALAEVRSAVAGYRSAGLEDEFKRAERTLAAAGIRAECSFENVRISAPHEGVLALALRESVTNVIRHAKASSCRIGLRRSGGAFELEVADDGRGFAGQEGFGLTGMRQRIEAFGGTFEFATGPGTRLLIRLPFEEKEGAA
jgi:two-component system sensor histidine kinase DesK